MLKCILRGPGEGVPGTYLVPILVGSFDRADIYQLKKAKRERNVEGDDR